MTKTLTEQWREGTLPAGHYYCKLYYNGFKPRIQECVKSRYDSKSCIPMSCGCEGEEVLAPVPDYGSLYNPNDGRIPVGLFTVLKLIKRDIEQYQEKRHLTDLECGIKSQVVSLLKRRGWDLGKDELVSNSDEFKDPYITNTEDCQQIVEDNLNRELENKNILLNSYKKENKRLNAVLKHIEKLAGEYIDELVDVKRKVERLEKRLTIATKALKGVCVWANTGNGGEQAVKKACEKALKEMEGVK